ncbi:MAG TPA: hypothetical protein VFN97_17655 [Actinospica sp.]|nr:hypothetical protein [Actinospica sp.]
MSDSDTLTPYALISHTGKLVFRPDEAQRMLDEVTVGNTPPRQFTIVSASIGGPRLPLTGFRVSSQTLPDRMRPGLCGQAYLLDLGVAAFAGVYAAVRRITPYVERVLAPLPGHR